MAAPPKFTSFPDLAPSDQTERSSKGKSKHKSEDDKGRKRKHRSEPSEPPKHAEGSRYYYSDRKGDPLNIHYDGLSADTIPKYNLVAHGRQVLGTPSLVVLFRSRKGLELGPPGSRKLPVLTDSKTRVLLSATPQHIKPLVDSRRYEEIDGFLPLSSSRHTEHHPAYRSITTENPSESDSDSSPDSSVENDGEIVLTAHQDALKALEQELATNPSSVSLWLALLSRTLSTIPHHSKNSLKSRSEVTISIISRAFSASPNNASSKLLRLKYLKAGEEVWPQEKVKAEWETAFDVEGMHIEWLDWTIKVQNDGINGVFNAAKRVLDILQEDELTKVRLFWRVAVACQQAGFPERAMAMFQAQAELSFGMPQSLENLSFEAKLDQLQDFWESEVPRLGEPDAKGWAAWISVGRPEQPLSAPAQEPSNQHDSDPFRLWARLESQVSLLPSRSSSDDTDPYAVVLFSDIRLVLLPLKSDTAKATFRKAWLALLGLSIPGFSESLSPAGQSDWDDRWHATHLAGRGYLDAIFPARERHSRITSDSHAGVVVGAEFQYKSGFGPIRYWGHNVLKPLNSFFGGLWKDLDVQGLDHDLTRRLFSQLRMGKEDTEWDTLALAFEAATDVKRALKLSRSFLSESRDSILRWTTHALLERIRGRTNEARKVYETVLTTRAVSPEACHLWWDWAEMEWLNGKPDAAISIILRASRATGSEGVAILRAKQYLTEQSDHAECWEESECWTKLRALLELLTSKDVDAMLRVFDDCHQVPESGTLPHESMVTAYLMILYQHGLVLKNPSKAATLRERTETALDLYPCNSVILGIFLEVERGQGVWGRVQRRMYGQVAENRENVYRKVQQVWLPNWDKARWDVDIERTRSVLNTALDEERTRGSAVIFRIYLEMEIRIGQLENAKRLLFRAIAECPLVKEFYLLAFGPLRSVFKSSELSAIGDTMAERGIRLRRGLDEMVMGWQEPRREDDSRLMEDVDDIERDAREYRRLVPY